MCLDDMPALRYGQIRPYLHSLLTPAETACQAMLGMQIVWSTDLLDNCHNIAISLIETAVGDLSVMACWRDYAHGHQTRTMPLEADEFLRRFLLHVLPASFVRIRYFGLLANRHRTQLLALCRSLLQTSPPSPIAASLGHLCQHCHRGTMRVVEYLSPAQVSAWLDAPQPENSS